MSVNLYKQKRECCGCTACANACPKSIIMMKADEEGFLYPSVIDEKQCIHCDLCRKVCPVKNAAKVSNFQERAIAGYSKDSKEIKASASGGLATAMSKGFILKENGVVYGVSYTNNCRCIEYVRAETAEQLELFRTSKYAQAKKNDVYQLVKADLLTGKKVLFFGLPCDTYALQLFLGKPDENLFVCALMCHGPTSPKVHEQFTEALIKKYQSEIKQFSVRYKKDGWKPYYVYAQFKNGMEHYERFDNSAYGIAFLYLKRPSCNFCQIKRRKIHSDITIGDYHLAASGKFQPYHPDGVSSAMIHTEKGIHMVELVDNFLVEKIPIKNVLYSEAYHRTIAARANRKEFGETFAHYGLEAACGLNSVQRIERRVKWEKMIRQQGAKNKKLISGK